MTPETRQLTLGDVIASEEFAAGLDVLEAVAAIYRARYGAAWRVDLQLALMAQPMWWAAAPRLRQVILGLVTQPDVLALTEDEYLAFEQARILEYLPTGSATVN